MDFFSKIGDMLTGGLANTALDAVKSYFPPDMTDEQKANVKLAFDKLELEKTIQVNKAIHEAQTDLNKRIADQEGTAKDLLSIPWVGKLIIFLRGCQRPLWGFGVMYGDLKWFSGDWGVLSQQQESALWVINLLVLGFLFGERAIKNLMPMITTFIASKK